MNSIQNCPALMAALSTALQDLPQLFSSVPAVTTWLRLLNRLVKIITFTSDRLTLTTGNGLFTVGIDEGLAEHSAVSSLYTLLRSDVNINILLHVNIACKHTETFNLACTDLLMNPNCTPKKTRSV